jgi:hypothetical protein
MGWWSRRVGLGFEVARMGFPMYSDHGSGGGRGWRPGDGGWLDGGATGLDLRWRWWGPWVSVRKGAVEGAGGAAAADQGGQKKEEWRPTSRLPCGLGPHASRPLPSPSPHEPFTHARGQLCAALPRTRSQRLHRSGRW